MAKKLTSEQIKAMADEIRTITIEEASALPGFLGRIIPVELREYGYATRTSPETGKKIFYQLKTA